MDDFTAWGHTQGEEISQNNDPFSFRELLNRGVLPDDGGDGLYHPFGDFVQPPYNYPRMEPTNDLQYRQNEAPTMREYGSSSNAQQWDVPFTGVHDTHCASRSFQITPAIMSNDETRAQDDDLIDDLIVVAQLHEVAMNTRPPRTPFHTSSLTGWAYVNDVINGHPKRCYRELRMSQALFLRLCAEMEQRFRWSAKREDSLRIHESVGMFICCLRGWDNGQIQERYQHSAETVYRHCGKMLDCMRLFRAEYIRPTWPQDRQHPYLGVRRQYSYFKDCIGAIDGTHVPCKPETALQRANFWSRKGEPTQNVIAACDFDLCFTFAAAGFEGSMHDFNIFKRVVYNDDYQFPRPQNGKYYLVDAGYPNRTEYMSPYKGYRYHQPTFRAGTENPRDDKELFNKAHSSLRSCVERTFGVWKRRFHMLYDMPRCKMRTQRDLALASMALHNYIRRHTPNEQLFEEAVNNPMYVFEDLPDSDDTQADLEDDTVEPQDDFTDDNMNYLRDSLRRSMHIANNRQRGRNRRG